jgi:hypothetical protein
MYRIEKLEGVELGIQRCNRCMSGASKRFAMPPSLPPSPLTEDTEKLYIVVHFFDVVSKIYMISFIHGPTIDQLCFSHLFFLLALSPIK